MILLSSTKTRGNPNLPFTKDIVLCVIGRIRSRNHRFAKNPGQGAYFEGYCHLRHRWPQVGSWHWIRKGCFALDVLLSQVVNSGGMIHYHHWDHGYFERYSLLNVFLLDMIFLHIRMHRSTHVTPSQFLSDGCHETLIGRVRRQDLDPNVLLLPQCNIRWAPSGWKRIENNVLAWVPGQSVHNPGW